MTLHRLIPFLIAGLLAVTPPASANCTLAGYVAEATPDADFTDNGDGTVIHTRTGLTWKRCAEGQTWSGGTCIGNATPLAWTDALSQASNNAYAGYTDWRLPNRVELESLVETACAGSPSINTSLFPAAPGDWTWSSTRYVNALPPQREWAVDFSTGTVGHAEYYSDSHYVRLVRGGQPYGAFDAASNGNALAVTRVNGGANPVVNAAFDVVVTSANVVGADTTVALKKNSGGGSLGGAVSCAIPGGQSTCTIAGAYLDTPGHDFKLAANAEGLSSGLSAVFAVLGDIADLSALALSSGSLAPTFAGGITGYSASVANGVSSVTVTPTAMDSAATVKVNGTNVASGTASASIGLDVGANTIAVLVTAEDGTTTQTYTIAVTRAGPTVVVGPSPSGTGDIRADLNGGGDTCVFSAAQFVPLSTVPIPPPAGLTFTHGLFDFTTTGCAAGSTITLTMTYPQALSNGTRYWKYGPTPDNASPHWYDIPATIDGNQITFSITDGGLGDDDWALGANGTIVDQGGPGAMPMPMGVPALSAWGLLILSGLLTLVGRGYWRRRGAER